MVKVDSLDSIHTAIAPSTSIIISGLLTKAGIAPSAATAVAALVADVIPATLLYVMKMREEGVSFRARENLETDRLIEVLTDIAQAADSGRLPLWKVRAAFEDSPGLIDVLDCIFEAAQRETIKRKLALHANLAVTAIGSYSINKAEEYQRYARILLDLSTYELGLLQALVDSPLAGGLIGSPEDDSEVGAVFGDGLKLEEVQTLAPAREMSSVGMPGSQEVFVPDGYFIGAISRLQNAGFIELTSTTRSTWGGESPPNQRVKVKGSAHRFVSWCQQERAFA